MPLNAEPPAGRPRIACLATYGGHAGGAAVAMRRLAAALEAAGAAVEVVARHAPDPAATGPTPVGDAAALRLERRIRRRIRHARTALSNTLFSADWPAWDVASHPAVAAADVLHVHWVAGFLDAEAVRRLVATGKPVVWTQHDLRAFTGGCHYPAGCRGFTADCRGCPQLAATLQPVAERSLRRSRRRLRGLPLAFVAPSRWLADELTRASLFDREHHAVHVIPNGIDLDRYAPAVDKAAARARLGLPPTGLAVAVGSQALTEHRKGGPAAAAALALLAGRLRSAGAPPPVAVSFGAGGRPLPGILHRHLGTLAEEGVIDALRACDAHLTMTREDNLPNTVVEALACGLPVVGTAVGGLPEMIAPDVEGWLVAVDDSAAAAAALARLAAEPPLLAATARAARRRAAADFDGRLQARRHLDLYHGLCHGPHAGAAGPAGGRPIGMTPAAAAVLAEPPLVRRGRRLLRRLTRTLAPPGVPRRLPS